MTEREMLEGRSEGVSDKDLDDIYEAIDALLRAGSFKFLDELLRDWEARAWRTPLDILLAYATATFPAKSKLPSRKMFMDRCLRLYSSKKLWKGLE